MTWTNGAYTMRSVALRAIGIVDEGNGEQRDRDHDAALRIKVVTDTQDERRERNEHDHQSGISAVARNGFVRFFCAAEPFPLQECAHAWNDGAQNACDVRLFYS